MNQHAHGCTCFIIPSKMLRKLADDTADAHERHCLLDQAELSAHLRGQRSVAPLVMGLVAATGEKRRTVYDGQNKSALPGKLVRSEDSKPPATRPSTRPTTAPAPPTISSAKS
jgi:hypothetical protein